MLQNRTSSEQLVNGTSHYAANDDEEQLALALAISASLAEQDQPYASRESPARRPTPDARPGDWLAGAFRNPLQPTNQPAASSTPPAVSGANSQQPASTGYKPVLSRRPAVPTPAPSAPAPPPTAPTQPTPAQPSTSSTASGKSSLRRLYDAIPVQKCLGCEQAIFASYITALGGTWHPGCFKCAFCSEVVGGAGDQQFAVGKDNKPYHLDCHRHCFNPVCTICGEFIPIRSDGKIEFKENAFWKEKYCPQHREDSTPQCCSCSRFQKHGEEWITLQDQRHLCLQCLGSIVMDTQDAQPLYHEILDFYQSLGMAHPEVAPLMLVDAPALNDYSSREGGRADGPVFHVRGLTLADVYRSIPSLVRTKTGSTWFQVDTESTVVERAHCNVTAILVLYGLPRLLTGCIIAHELMHAWLRMKGITGLEAQVEEGLCQLMALLWLDREREKQSSSPASSSDESTPEERLGAYFGYQIRSDTSPIYGDGFRIAFEAYQQFGLKATVDNVMAIGQFPVPSGTSASAYEKLSP